MTSQPAFHNSFEPPWIQKEKSKLSSKISKFDKQLDYITNKLQCSEEIRKALVDMKKSQKKKQHRRLNQGQQRGWSNKKVNLWKNINSINIIDYLKFTISLALYFECATNFLIFSANESKYILQL